MGKEKTVALERAKKATAKAKGKKSSRGGSSSRYGLSRGWIQGDWIRSTIRQDDIDDLVEGGLILHESARHSDSETEPHRGRVNAFSLQPMLTMDFLCLPILFSEAS